MAVLGLITCAGSAGRFAHSIGIEGPFPKHLQYLEEPTTILERAVDALVSMVPVDAIAITVNPQMLDPYLEEIRRISNRYPQIPFSYVPDEPGIGAFTNNTLAQHLQSNLYNLIDGTVRELTESVLAHIHGDVVLQIEDEEKLQRAVTDALVEIEGGGESRLLVADPIFGGSVLALARVDDFDKNRFKPLGMASDFGIRIWNINTVYDLIVAKKELSYPLTEAEIQLEATRKSRRRIEKR